MEVIKDIRTRKGANLNLKGGAEKILDKTVSPSSFSIRPDDFFGIAPKLILKEGASVKLGSPIFFSKEKSKHKVCFTCSWNYNECCTRSQKKNREYHYKGF